jgi:transcriptional regulator with XRE-family HTH domain
MDRARAITRQIGEQIRQARQSKQMTLGALAKATSLSTPFLSRLERGAASASIANLIQIAGVLDIALHDLFGGHHDPQPPSYALVKRQVRQSSPMLSAAGYTYEKLGDDLAGQRLEAFELEFPVGAHKEILLVAHEGEEVLFLLSGKIEFQIGSDRFLMEEGDCVHFDCEQPHMGRNIGAEPARMLMVVATSRAAARRFGWWNAPTAMPLSPPAEAQSHGRAASDRKRSATKARKP